MDAFIIDAVRTPRGKGRADGALNEVPPAQLAAGALRAVAERNNVAEGQVTDVVLGIVEPIGDQGGNLTRIAALEAVSTAASRIMAGQADLTIGGGVESMSRVPMTASGIPMALDADLAMPHNIVPQGISADLMATKFGYSRTDVDAYAAASQQRACAAWDAGAFDKSIVPVVDDNDLTILDRDELLRPGTTVESLSSLNAAFEMMGKMGGMNAVAMQKHPDVQRIEHVHTAGNSSGIVDGASAVLLASQAGADALGRKPRAVIRGFDVIGTEPCIMLTGPEAASERLLARLRMSASDIDLFELNEAFAGVVLRYMEALSIDHDAINVNGGAIAMGHPLGATGAMILGTLLDELERRDKTTGLATLCVGGGMGIAMVIERVSA
ncbi:MAG: acetyl-CoA C-acyltransferase [Pseudomonadota bacterium]